ncbi:shikimate dehydrogenase family protein [Parvibacter caecicola]|uniref:shikimate dehydrogenase family protein n=1 Tax=Parvibacter caecicola TaxID=747645 RepID=UPI00249C76AB|nr:hypothetical protein [Parvibacter caecicola]
MTATGNDEAKQLYVLGHPVAHSKSPAMYNALYGYLTLPWTYGLMDIADASQAAEFLDAREFFSINITTPYKPLALEKADVKAASAQLAGGCNLLISFGEKLLAYNTDGEGCVAYLERAGVNFAGKRVAVCGTGPTSLAIYHAAAIAGAAEVLLLGRQVEKAKAQAQGYVRQLRKMAEASAGMPAAHDHHRSIVDTYRDCSFKYGSYATSTKAITAADVIIDATPLGMHAGDPAPFDPALLSDGQFVMDVVYGHGETALAKAAKERGCQFVNGAGMLVGQAVVTALILFDLSGVETELGFDGIFRLMADAGFPGQL